MVTFWKVTISDYQKEVTSSAFLQAEDLMKNFTLHGLVPNGIPDILAKLVKDRKFATYQSLAEGTFYEGEQEKSLAQKVGGFFWG